MEAITVDDHLGCPSVCPGDQSCMQPWSSDVDPVWWVIGSKDSLDCDVVLAVTEKPSAARCYELTACNGAKWHTDACFLQVAEGRPLNVNIIVIQQHACEANRCYVVDCFKGSPDAVHNCLVDSGPLHAPLVHPLPLLGGPMTLNVVLRCMRFVRDTLSVARVVCDDDGSVKRALRCGRWSARLAALARLEWSRVYARASVSQRKALMFCMASVVGVIRGHQWYTKAGLGAAFGPLVQHALERRTSGDDATVAAAAHRLQALCDLAHAAMARVQEVAGGRRWTALVLPSGLQPRNCFEAQATCMVVHMDRMVCLGWGRGSGCVSSTVGNEEVTEEEEEHVPAQLCTPSWPCCAEEEQRLASQLLPGRSLSGCNLYVAVVDRSQGGGHLPKHVNTNTLHLLHEGTGTWMPPLHVRDGGDGSGDGGGDEQVRRSVRDEPCVTLATLEPHYERLCGLAWSRVQLAHVTLVLAVPPNDRQRVRVVFGRHMGRLQALPETALMVYTRLLNE